MSDSFHANLTSRTSPVPWDQVLIVSQYVLNEQFANMWKVAKAGSPLLHCKISSRDKVEYIDGDLAAPSIDIHVTDTSFTFWYTMTFLSGTANLYAMDSGDETVTLDLTGFKLKFQTTKLGVDTLDETDDLYTEFFGNTTIQVDRSAVFSLQRLFIESIDASLMDKSSTVYGKYGDFTQWQANQTATVQIEFANLINTWFISENVHKTNLLGISLQTTQPATVNPDAPSFPPTYVGRGVYAWLDPSVPDPVLTDGLDQNAFCYLIMTGTRHPTALTLDHSGNFVNATNVDGAKLCVNAHQFWLQWFLPQFTSLNRYAEIYCTEPTVTVTADDAKIRPNFYVGSNPDHPDPSDTYFNFALASTDPTKSPLPAQWNASGAGLSSTKTDESGSHGSWDKMVMDEDATTNVTFNFTPGGQQINISGTSYFHMHVKQTGLSSGPTKTESDGTVTVTWNANYALGDAPKGGLAIVPYPDPSSYFTIGATETDDDSIGWDKDWSHYTRSIEDSIESGIQSGLSSVLHNLSTALSQQHRFIMPGAGNFLFSNAIFNQRGDLILSLAYNGVPRFSGVESSGNGVVEVSR